MLYYRSYPYLSLALMFDVPYWCVLCFEDETVWGEMARRELDHLLTIHDHVFFSKYHRMIKEGKHP